MPLTLTVVLDVGKTATKATLWAPDGDCIGRQVRANRKIETGTYLSLDVEGIETWLAAVLSEFSSLGRIGSIVPVAHGAAAAIIRDGQLAAPPLDYEFEPPEAVRADYLNERDAFALNGSPAMGMSLNLGLQLYYLERLIPDLMTGNATIVPWAQYWAWRLCGVAACEISSLGSHTDLWSPANGRPSPMAARLGWAKRLAPMRHAAAAIGTLSPEWVGRTGLPANVLVHAGVHDSNAALHAARAYPEISGQEATVVSTGTWFVAMRSPGPEADLISVLRTAHAGCLINVDPAGDAVPTVLFMGGREIELLSEGLTHRLDDPDAQAATTAGVEACLTSGAMVLPTMVPGTGAFPDRVGGWVDRPLDQAQASAAIALYAALAVDNALDLIGSRDRLLIEGRFAGVQTFVRALATLRPGARILSSTADGDVSFGALRLVRPDVAPSRLLGGASSLDTDLNGYRALWRRRLGLIA
ncbi:MAG: carbohydrate kinase [Caulobacterales bacterium]|nr:carbohydrate kinase [Caulobacterales bacterium]